MADQPTTPQECPICGSACEVQGPPVDSQGYTVFCKLCGDYGVIHGFGKALREGRISAADRQKVAAVIFERRTLDPENVDAKGNSYRWIHPPGHKVNEEAHRPDQPNAFLWDDLLRSFPSTVADRLDRCITLFCKLSKTPGEPLDIGGLNVYAGNIKRSTFSENDQAMEFVLEHLSESGLIRLTRPRGSHGVTRQYTVQAKGWNRVADLERERGRHGGRQAFIAMRLKDESSDKATRESLEAGIKAAGYVPVIVNAVEHNGKICDRIIAEIRKSRFLVAEFSGHRQNVYYEAGFAQGLGLTVIWCCPEVEIEDAHFDTRQYNHITWTSPEELARKLEYRIRATVT